jgi:hypothetical protein
MAWSISPPPDHHLLVRPDGTLELSRAEAVHFSRLRELVRANQDGSPGILEAVVEATNRRGKAVRCRITCAPRLGPDHRVGLILLMEELGAAGDGAFR